MAGDQHVRTDDGPAPARRHRRQSFLPDTQDDKVAIARTHLRPRQLERLLASALRKVAATLAVETGSVVVDEPDLRELLGRPRFTSETAERTAVPGVATGLAVTGMGGGVLSIKANAVDAESGHGGQLKLTGQLGDVVKESAQIALS